MRKGELNKHGGGIKPLHGTSISPWYTKLDGSVDGGAYLLTFYHGDGQVGVGEGRGDIVVASFC